MSVHIFGLYNILIALRPEKHAARCGLANNLLAGGLLAIAVTCSGGGRGSFGFLPKRRINADVMLEAICIIKLSK
jgi:hypothetical protein